MSNFKRISSHLYKVTNQNGFNQALYDYFKDRRYSKKEVRQMVQNYPIKYPSMFVIVDQSFECARLYVEIIDINELI